MSGLVEKYLDSFVESLEKTGCLKTGWMKEAVRRVPRHAFIDEYVDDSVNERPVIKISRADISEEHLKRIYADQAVAIRDKPSFSSSSQPSLMFWMLSALSLERGKTVLEIGTGTGWNAGLMAVGVGNGRLVFSIDNQEDLIESARGHLAKVALGDVNLKAGDGGLGWPDKASFDRLIVTAASEDIPPAWQEQLAEGGVLVLPFHMGSHGDPILRLEKKSGGMRGGFVSWSGFTPLKGKHGIPESSKKTTLEELVGKLQCAGRDMPKVPLPEEQLKERWWELTGNIAFFMSVKGMSFEKRWLTNPGSRGGMEIYFCDNAAAAFGYDFIEPVLRIFGESEAAASIGRYAGEWLGLGMPGLTAYAVESCDPADNGGGDGELILRRPSITLRVTVKGKDGRE